MKFDKSSLSDISISVAMVTYNQEKYIAQAIESILMQKTGFNYELVIGEDYSTDGTRTTVLEYAKKYPQRIRLVLQERNVGAHSNFISTLNECRGKYIALCEGDDFWTDCLKLEKQASFLESHPDFSICFHNVLAFSQEGDHLPYYFCKPDQKKVSTINDLLISNFIQTVSVLYRRGLFINFPEWYYTIKIGDWPLHIINAQYGKIGYLNEAMANYRVHKNSLWNTMDRLDVYNSIVNMLHHIDTYLEYKYSPIINSTISGYFIDIAALYVGSKDYKNARHYLADSFHKFSKNFWKSRYFLSLFYGSYLPRLYRLAKVYITK